MFNIIAIVFFWLPLGLLTYHWFGFPLILWLLVKIYRSKTPQGEGYQLPKVTVAIAAWNEELTIEAKLHNCLSLEYPKEKMEILVGTDAVTDRTNEIVLRFAENDSRIHLITVSERIGKSAVINLLAKEASGDVILFTDADVLLEPNTLMAGVKHFYDPKVGLVLPAYKRVNKEGVAPEGLWDKYENKIKEMEGKLGVAVGVYGWAMFMRRSAFYPLPPDTINDDYVLGIFAFRRGYRSVYEPNSISWTKIEPPEIEFKRKMRISRGNAQQFFRYSDILLPKYGLVAFVFFSHKYLRWLGPFFLLSMFAASGINARTPFFLWMFVLQLIIYSTTPLLLWMRGFWRKFLFPQYFIWTNLALLAGYWQFLFGKRLKYNWLRTERRID
ncbi:MAG: glycosyltransferase family 2 protein [candidate division WOR-3 bacterium]